MTVTRADFAGFFEAVNGVVPFAWQERLLDHLLEHGRWPERLVAPTGAGKSSVIDVHVFATALTAGAGGPRLPRRLAMVVGRRVLVDDQYQRALALADHLADPKGAALIGQVAQELSALRFPAHRQRVGGERGSDSPLVVARLRGGALPARAWRDEISACAVICATPDMWGSRLLLRGYGTSAQSAPREAGALALDAAVVVDEAHLSRQLLVTARRVSELAAVAEGGHPGVPLLQVVETTATPAAALGGAVSVSVEEPDLAEDGLRERLTRPKPLSVLPVPGWPAAKDSALTEALADAVVSLLTADPRTSAPSRAPHTVGCFVNSVPVAAAVVDSLRTRQVSGCPVRAVLVCGPTRPADLQRLRKRYPGLLTTAGNSEVDVIVSTQSLEVGADLDLAGVVTELAPGSALAQRAGRANRLGMRARAAVTVAVPEDAIPETARSGPYQADELENALAWVRRRADDPLGMAPWALRSDPPPAALSRRTLYQRPELADAWHWARTSEDLAAEPELDLWLAESFESETAIGIVVRDALPAGPDGVVFVRDMPPLAHEVFPVPYGTARTALQGKADVPAIRVRGEEVAQLGFRTNTRDEQVADIRPGDLVVVDSSTPIFTGGAIGDGFSPHVVAGDIGTGTADDVLHHLHDGTQVVLRLELLGSDAGPVAGISLAGLDDALEELSLDVVKGERERRRAMAAFLAEVLARSGACTAESRPMVEAARELMALPTKASDIVLSHDTEEALVRILLLDRRNAAVDEGLRQVFSTRSTEAGPVTLDQHQAAVAARAQLLARELGLPEQLVESLRLAGAHHDDGKADPRFQQRLGAEPGGVALAKSDPASTAREVRARESLAGLPARWRHEQLSALTWITAGRTKPADATDVDDELVARLVGTSHGYGRSDFPHTTAALLPNGSSDWADVAREWFDRGGWDALIERTHLRYGVWGCAFLEALLRAADGQVSREGS